MPTVNSSTKTLPIRNRAFLSSKFLPGLPEPYDALIRSPTNKLEPELKPPPLIRRFRAEHALEARADKLHAHHFLALIRPGADVHHFALRLEILLAPARHHPLEGNTDLEIGANRHVEPGAKRGSAAAQILAGSFFLERKSARVAAAHAQRQAHRDSTFGPLPGYALDDWAHRLASPHPRPSPRRNVPRSPRSLEECAPNARFFEARCHSPRRA